MSVAYYLLFFLCILLHACSARLLSTLDKKLEKKPHFSIKDNEKNGLDTIPKEIGGMNEGNNRMKTWLVPQKPRKRRSTNQKVLKAMIKNSGAIQTKSLANSSVSWRVPHKKPRKKDPGFNLDYSPPKTHPPSHN
ncbi:hypothetical protein VNO77_20022 [Canavalia gladiata]|uniref:Uncharacterized protein n=1 Tax=Canavalia gladiata TaxID=3824 RepID=A0AAN9LNW1_CANGL